LDGANDGPVSGTARDVTKQADEKKQKENKEKNFCYAGSSESDARESKHSGEERDDKKAQCKS
jgi:hypothetical protein